MLPLRFSIGAFVFLAFGAAAACSSSSSSKNADTSDGGDDGNTGGDDATNPLMINATCGALSAIGGGGTSMTCPKGMSCCTMLSLSGGSASCVAEGSCSGGISTECASASDCSSNQVCCVGSPDAGAPMMPDAAAAGGGAGGFGGLGGFDLSMFSSYCQSSCAATQTQECTTDTECPSGQTCQGFGGFGGAGGGEAGAAGGIGGINIMLPKTCMAPRPDAGNPPPVEDSGSDSMVDTGTPPTPTPDADTSDVAAGD